MHIALATLLLTTVLAAPLHATVWGKLTTLDGKTSYPLEKSEIIVGSAPTADVVLKDATVSARHLRLRYADGYVQVEDLGSRDGTLLDGTLLKKGKPSTILQKGNVSPGAVSLVFTYGERPALLSPVGAAKAAPEKGKGSKKTKPVK